MYTHLDETIGTLLDRLDALVGKDQYVVALTADHGVTPMPEQLKPRAWTRDGSTRPRCATSSSRRRRRRSAQGTYVSRENGNDVYFAPGVYAKLGAKAGALQRVIDGDRRRCPASRRSIAAKRFAARRTRPIGSRARRRSVIFRVAAAISS